MQTCPHCNGKGDTGPVHINRGSKPHEWRDNVPCTLCMGSGQVSDDVIEACALGKALRDKRVANDESLREASKRLGMSPAELSRLEQGRGGMAAWRHPFATRAYLEATQQGRGPETCTPVNARLRSSK